MSHVLPEYENTVKLVELLFSETTSLKDSGEKYVPILSEVKDWLVAKATWSYDTRSKDLTPFLDEVGNKYLESSKRVYGVLRKVFGKDDVEQYMLTFPAEAIAQLDATIFLLSVDNGMEDIDDARTSLTSAIMKILEAKSKKSQLPQGKPL
jgi:hypothetical protein